MVHLLHESRVSIAALKVSFRKICVFLGAVLTVVVVVDAVIFLIEKDHPGTAFTSIPAGMYGKQVPHHL